MHTRGFVTQEDLIATALAKAEAELACAERAKQALEARVAALRSAVTPAVTQLRLPVLGESPVARTASEKVRLFRSLFRGRVDVFPKRWENHAKGRSGYSPACRNEWVRGICEKPKVKCSECNNQAFIPVDDKVILDHLNGKHTAGVYALLSDDTCWFVAADFDEESWRDDVAAFAETCRSLALPVAIERSRSGNGAHAWFFFDGPVAAVNARRMASFVLTETMRTRKELDLRSYDRLFPAQDTLPEGGFGNLIALPFQFEPRKAGNSLFLDERLEPYPWDAQWRFLAAVDRMAGSRVSELAAEAVRTGRVLGVRAPAVDPDEAGRAPWDPHPTEPPRLERLPFAVPAAVKAVLAHRLIIAKAGLPPSLIARFRRLAAFQNPEFYKRQSLRLSVALTPRVIVCAQETADEIALPRGCREEVEALLSRNASRLDCEDSRQLGVPLPVKFIGTLTDTQAQATTAVALHEMGVLAAPPGAGKTVMGAHLIAARGVNTLVLVHRRPLLDQWVNQLALFLGVAPSEIGQIAGGRRKPNGCLDVAMIQSLVRRDAVDDLVARYGHVVVDECHHIPAVSFERVLGQVRARYVTGLTATPRRRDGHHPIAEMQLGPVRHSIDARAEAEARPFTHKLIARETSFAPGEQVLGIQDLYRRLARDDARNQIIARDVGLALEEGRVPLVLTERRDHVDVLADLVRGFCPRVVVLRGGADGKAGAGHLATLSASGDRVIVATGRFVGEGFNDPGWILCS